MKDKIKISIVVILIVFILIMCLMAVIKSKSDIGKTDMVYENINISFEDENIVIEEEFHLKKKGYISMPKIPIQTTNFSNDNLQLYLDNVKGFLTFRNLKGYLYITNINDIIGDGLHTITARYILNSSEVVKAYKNIDAINIKFTGFTQINQIKVALPNNTENFTISDKKLSYDKSSKNEYIINASEMRKDISILVDKGLIDNAEIVNEDYNIANEEQKNEDIEKAANCINLVFIVITVLNIIIVVLITANKKREKNYHRETDDIIDPVLAESIIDRKISAKNLIMAVIVEQISKNNILLEDDRLTLKCFDKKSKIKEQIIEMFFTEEGKTINIKDFAKVFKDSSSIDYIIDVFKTIKNKIIKIFYDNDIYDKKKKKQLKVIRITSIISIVVELLYIIYLLWGYAFIIKGLIAILIAAFILYLIFKRSKIIYSLPVLSIPIVFFIVMIIGLFLVGITPYKAYSIQLVEIIKLVLITGINVLVIFLSKKHVFTKKGLIEYDKIKGLYDYLIDYSLMKERDINSVIIWDKYLVYATAFGIPNKVTNRFSEELMKMGDVLNKINIILSERF